MGTGGAAGGRAGIFRRIELSLCEYAMFPQDLWREFDKYRYACPFLGSARDGRERCRVGGMEVFVGGAWEERPFGTWILMKVGTRAMPNVVLSVSDMETGRDFVRSCVKERGGDICGGGWGEWCRQNI